jgi:hypothetical protein
MKVFRAFRGATLNRGAIAPQSNRETARTSAAQRLRIRQMMRGTRLLSPAKITPHTHPQHTRPALNYPAAIVRQGLLFLLVLEL